MNAVVSHVEGSYDWGAKRLHSSTQTPFSATNNEASIAGFVLLAQAKAITLMARPRQVATNLPR